MRVLSTWALPIAGLFSLTIGPLTHGVSGTHSTLRNGAGSDDQMRECVQGVVDAKNPEEASKYYRKLFRLVDAKQLHELTHHASDGIALRARWEEIKVTSRKEADKGAALDRATLHRFVGFAEGRLHVSVPDWWSDTLLGATTAGDNSVVFLRLKDHSPLRVSESGMFTTVGTAVEVNNLGVVLKRGQEVITIPRNVIQKKSLIGLRISTCHDGDRDHVAIHDQFSYPYALYRWDKSGNPAWNADVWAGGGLVNYVGLGHHSSTVVVSKGRVLVFGAGEDAVYVEGFDAANGRVLFRFSTAY